MKPKELLGAIRKEDFNEPNYNLHYYANDEILKVYSYYEFKERLEQACVLCALKETAIDLQNLYYFYLITNVAENTTIIKADSKILFFSLPNMINLTNLFFL